MANDTSSPNYTVLARRYRPQTFADVVGQEHVATALQNAIQANRVAHAYLFTGARGVGKTSMARILAKALNCVDSHDGIPCNTCELCEMISAGHDVDVLEIDGASNRGIDDIRSLRANVNVKSMRTKFKVYIIDEVHMLTKEAFNALLKTLEEPPPNVKFVFCTTEPNKVPDTILSRCQRFDFASIETQNIAQRLKEISDSEGIAVAPEAIELVARRADGSMRDSQSLFDQLLAFGGELISTDDVNRLLGTAGDDRLLNCVSAALTQNRPDMLSIVDTAIGEGVQIGNLVDQLMFYFRDLMILASGATAGRLLSVSEHYRETLLRQANATGLSTIVAGLQILADTKTRLQRSSNPRPLLELALVRISLLENMDAIGAIAKAIKSGQPVNWQNVSPPVIPSADAAPTVSEPVEIPSPTQKKSDDTEEIPDSEPEPDAPIIEFEEKQLDSIWTQLVATVDDSIAVHLKAAANTAISGPKSLEVTYTESYTFSKQYFERRPEAVSGIEDVLETIVGQRVRVQFRITKSQQNPEHIDPTTEPKQDVFDPENDPYIQDACSAFGATVVKTEPLTRRRNPDER